MVHPLGWSTTMTLSLPRSLRALCLIAPFALLPACRDPDMDGARSTDPGADVRAAAGPVPPGAGAAATAAAPDDLPGITADELATAYAENTVAADRRFKGRRFRVRGSVREISTDLFDRPYLVLDSRNSFNRPQFTLGARSRDLAARLQRGMHVSLVCTGKGDVAKTPLAQDCRIEHISGAATPGR